MKLPTNCSEKERKCNEECKVQWKKKVQSEVEKKKEGK
jgi:hypothetical protein